MKTLIFLILVSALTFQQKPKTNGPIAPCDLTVAHSPMVRGLRLHQEFKELPKILRRRHYLLEEKANEIGLRHEIYSRSSLADPALLNGIDILSLHYLDDNLSSIQVHYNHDVNWQSNLHFVSAIAESLNLPRDGWRGKDPSELWCKGFFVKASSGEFIPTLQITLDGLADEIVKRQAALERQRREQFKP